MDVERIYATYRIETPGSLDDAARSMACEQPTGTFVPIRDETPASHLRHAAQVESVEAEVGVGEPSRRRAPIREVASKNGERMANFPHSPFDERVEAVMTGLRNAVGHTGKLMMYAFNVTDELDAMLRHVDAVAEKGGTRVMVSVNAVALGALRQLGLHGLLPIRAHRDGWGALTKDSLLGYSRGTQ